MGGCLSPVWGATGAAEQGDLEEEKTVIFTWDLLYLPKQKVMVMELGTVPVPPLARECLQPWKSSAPTYTMIAEPLSTLP